MYRDNSNLRSLLSQSRRALACMGFVCCTGLAVAQPAPKESLKAFEVVRSVSQHPRCQNCHIPGGAPPQYDQGLTHAQFVKRGADGRGAIAMECTSCNHDQNLPASYGDNVPPGASNWNLPPPEMKMVFVGLTPQQLCETINNKPATGGKDLQAMLVHVRDDKLVAWGWNPGGHRTLPAVSRAETVAAFKTWIDAGAPCPEQ